MRKKIVIATIAMASVFSNVPNAYAEDVWSSSGEAAGEWGIVVVNDYVVTDSIRKNESGVTVTVKHVGDISKDQIFLQEYEFRQKDGLWCSYVKTSSWEAYAPVSTHVNDSIVSIFDICRQYSSFIILSDADIKAKEAKAFFDRGTRLYFEDQDYRQSVDCFTNAIKLYPEYYDAYIRRARAYDGLRDYDRAIADYKYVIESGKDEYNIAKNELNNVMKKKRG